MRVAACTVHFVAVSCSFMGAAGGTLVRVWFLLSPSVFQVEVDAGAIMVQEAVPVLGSDTEESLWDRIREAEHRAFPAALELVGSGALRLGEDGCIIWNRQEFMLLETTSKRDTSKADLAVKLILYKL